MHTTIKLSVEKSKPWITSPHFITPKDESVKSEKGEYAALGIDADLREASKKALRGMIAWLVSEKGLSREEAYMLASVAADLKIAEIVDMPHYAVACSLPLSVFMGAPYV
jgi:acetamidase/formamidase